MTENVNKKAVRKVLKTNKEYKRTYRTEFEIRLNRDNITEATNAWAVPFIRDTAPFSDWRRQEMQELNSRPRKPMAIH